MFLSLCGEQTLGETIQEVLSKLVVMWRRICGTNKHQVQEVCPVLKGL